MEQHKLEKQFREQLNAREIKPSEKAWEKLDAMLAVAEEKKPNRRFTWVYVAASFVGFLLMATFYFSQKENTIQNQKNGVVIQNPVTPKTDAIPSVKVDFKIEKKGSIVNVVRQSTSKSDKSSVSGNDSLINKNNFNQNQITELSIINQKNEQESNTEPTKNLTVDELLVIVNQSARLNCKPNSNLQVHVNANQLLQQLDTDMEPAYRQSVLSKVAENFRLVKEAVVNRNKE